MKLHFLIDVDMSKDDLVKLVHEKEELLKAKDDEIKDMKDKVLRSYAEMENIMARTKRESENSKKYAIQVCCHNLSHHGTGTMQRSTFRDGNAGTISFPQCKNAFKMSFLIPGSSFRELW